MAKVKEKPVFDYKDGKLYVLQPGTTIYCKTADICDMIGKSNQWVGQLTSQGTFFKTKTAHGSLYDIGECIRSYIKFLEEKADRKDDTKDVALKKERAEAKYKESKATIAEIQAKELIGEMHRSEDVAAMTTDLIYAIRGALLALPGRVASEVITAKNAVEAAEMIRAELYKIMEDLSEYEYDSDKYIERARERLNMETASSRDEEDDEEDG